MKKQEPASEQDIRLQFGLLQVMVKELEARVKELERKQADLIGAVNGHTAVIAKMQQKEATQ
jgi:hypothetical protein